MNESVVRRLWLAGGWPPGALRTTDGAPLQVVFPGRWGGGAGPDLRDAILARPDGTLLQGDVELHVRSSDWRAHGHGGDPRYERVVLHVVWRHDLDVGLSPTVALGDLDETLLFERLRNPVECEERYHDWLREMSEAERGDLVDRLGDERLASHALRIASDLNAVGPEEALHRALCDALGYSQNRPAFRRLAEAVPAEVLRQLGASASGVVEAEAVLLNALLTASGLLDDTRVGRLPLDGRAAAAAFAGLAGCPVARAVGPGQWELVGVRPANRPPRRIAALARLYARTDAAPLAETVVAALRAAEPRLAVRRLLELVSVPAETGGPADYWAWHHDFGRRLPAAPLALVGPDRARAILANVLLPFGLAAADATGDEHLSRATLEAWAVAPSAGRNWITAEMRAVVGRACLGGSRREQGAIELYRRCCESRRCLTCPTAVPPALRDRR